MRTLITRGIVARAAMTRAISAKALDGLAGAAKVLADCGCASLDFCRKKAGWAPRSGKTFGALLMVALATLTLGGCVIAIDANEWDDADRTPGWRQRQHLNADAIDQLQIGRSLESVQNEMGDPDFSEAFQREDARYQVLFYRTRHLHGDGSTSKDETTPLVFIEGALVGWGDAAIDKATR